MGLKCRSKSDARVRPAPAAARTHRSQAGRRTDARGSSAAAETARSPRGWTLLRAQPPPGDCAECMRDSHGACSLARSAAFCGSLARRSCQRRSQSARPGLAANRSSSEASLAGSSAHCARRRNVSVKSAPADCIVANRLLMSSASLSCSLSRPILRRMRVRSRASKTGMKPFDDRCREINCFLNLRIDER